VSFDVTHPEVIRAVEAALSEDIGTGDITSELCIPLGTKATGRMIAREPMTLAGVELLPLIFETLAPRTCRVYVERVSGTQMHPGEEIAYVEGPARILLTGERTALNFVQRLSGVATMAHAYVKEVAHTKCRVLDTRKTTPGLRRLEKMAAAAGGVKNHRAGLYDAILIKNNHISAAGSVTAALERTRSAQVPVEIEVRTMAELDEALAAGARNLLLDNLTPEEAKQWIDHIAGRATVELSGGINLLTAKAYADTGADYISSGAITHSARAVDINFRLTLNP
jgi:nicotinate-nucleotide pyrophosphorylase (carboxylating)